jgi:hypothetical protein
MAQGSETLDFVYRVIHDISFNVREMVMAVRTSPFAFNTEVDRHDDPVVFLRVPDEC